MKLVLSIKTRKHNLKWDISRMLEVLSYLIMAILIWSFLVLLMGCGSDTAWM